MCNCSSDYHVVGLLTILKYSYPRDVDEIHDYQSVTEHFLSGIDRRKQEISQTRAYSVS